MTVDDPRARKAPPVSAKPSATTAAELQHVLKTELAHRALEAVGSNDFEGQRVIAEDEQATAQDLLVLTATQDWRILERILQHPNATKELIDFVLYGNIPFPEARMTPKWVFVEEKAAMHPNLSATARLELGQRWTRVGSRRIERSEKHWVVREKLAQRSDLTGEELTRFARDSYWAVTVHIAARAGIANSLIDELSRSAHWQVRERVALRPDNSDAVLARLARDPYNRVRARVGYFLRCHPERLPELRAELAADHQDEVSAAVTSPTYVPPEDAYGKLASGFEKARDRSGLKWDYSQRGRSESAGR